MSSTGGGDTLRLIFFGTPDFAAIGLTALLSTPRLQIAAVVTQPDRPAGRGTKLQPSPVKTLACAKGIPVLQPESVRGATDSFLRGLAPSGPFDAGVVIAFGQILPAPVLNLPRAGCINVHASLLPRWRGAAPIQRALMAGDAATGICLMKMEAGLDSGPVYCRAEEPIQAEDTFETLHDRLAILGAQLICRQLPAICRGEIIPQPQDHAAATYARRILNAEAEIDWSKTAPEIARQVQALSPAPGARTRLRGDLLKVLKAGPSQDHHRQASPGTVIAAADPIQIACGDGSVLLHEVQLAGKKRLSAREFLRGCPLAAGEILGGGDVP